MLLSGPALDWSRVQEISGTGPAARPLLLALALAHDLLGATVPADLLQQARADHAVTTAAGEVCQMLTAPEPPPRMSSVRKTWFTMRLAPTFRLKARHLAARLKAPTEADAVFVRLPPSLVSLYYPLRAARLAAKYGRAVFVR
jgi:hypothetical protein